MKYTSNKDTKERGWLQRVPPGPMSPKRGALFPKKQIDQWPRWGPLEGVCFSTSVTLEAGNGTH